MAAFLPLACFLGLWAAFARRKTVSAREAFLAASVVWGLQVAVFSEMLSALGQLTSGMLTLAWAAAALVAAVFAFQTKWTLSFPLWRCPRPAELILGACVGLVILLTLATALWAAPNNWDSMTYHLPRVYRWLQDRGVAFFPTNFAPQLHNPPWSGYAILQLLALKGDDRFVNLVQWFSMCGSVVGVSLIAQRLGAAPRVQLFAAVFCATLPMGVLQASSTNNNYVTAYWLVCFTYYLLGLYAQPSWAGAAAAGAGLGLALFTKPTAYVFAAPLAAWLLAAWLLQPPERRPRLAARFAVLVGIALSINTPHYVRNYNLFGAVLGPGKEGDAGEYDYRNTTHSPAALASNVLRNLALELRTPWLGVNYSLEKKIVSCHHWLGVNVSDPQTTWPGWAFNLQGGEPHSEDVSGNLFHTLLILVVGMAALLGGGIWRDGRVAGLAGALALCLLLFCFLFRWQPWHNRLHLRLFVLASPLVAMGFARRRLFPVLAAAVFLTAWAEPFLVSNQTRPLLGAGNVRTAPRVGQYFNANPPLKGPYVEAARLLRRNGCRTVGVVSGMNRYEYPLWVLLNGGRLGVCRVEDVDMANCSARLPSGGRFHPDGLVVLGEARPPRLDVNGAPFQNIWTCQALAVYLREARP